MSELTNSAPGGLMIKESISGRLEREKKQLEGRLAQINLALEELNKNPEVKKTIDILSQITHF